jgi:uncharacterized protein (DUF1697 family)
MPRYAAFLRGVNLGRHRRVSGAELRSAFEQLGATDVATFRASGNVAFAAAREPVAGLIKRFEAGLAKRLGFPVEVFLRTAGEMRAMAAHEPFARSLVEASDGKLQVALLGAEPTPRARRRVLALAGDDDRLAFGERELYWLPSAGTQDSALDLDAIAELLGSTTMRTKGTVDAMAAKYFAD